MKLQPYQQHMMKMLNKPNAKLIVDSRKQDKSLQVLELFAILRKAQEK